MNVTCESKNEIKIRGNVIIKTFINLPHGDIRKVNIATLYHVNYCDWQTVFREFQRLNPELSKVNMIADFQIVYTRERY